MGAELSGGAYQENRYFLIERPQLAPEGFAVLRTCYILTPTIPTRSLVRDSTAFALMKFVVKWMSATIPANHTILEDKLVLESIGEKSGSNSEVIAQMQAQICRLEVMRRCSSGKT